MGRKRSIDRDRFARIPDDVMLSPALATAPHAAFRVLAILLVGQTKERNGTLACSESYAAKYGLTSRETVHRSLLELRARGLIVVTRRVQKLKRFPTLYAVTWWPIHNRDGQPVNPPEPATHAYAQWKPITPIVGVNGEAGENFPSHRLSGDITPTIGVENAPHHTDSRQKGPSLHTDYRWNSRSGYGGRIHAGVEQKVRKLLIAQPHLSDHEIAHTLRNIPSVDATVVARVRQQQ